MKTSLFIITVTGFLSFGFGGEKEPHPAPLQEELLSQPIILKNCPGIKITEWRGSDGKSYTEPNTESVNVLNITCKKSSELFFKFVQDHGYNIKSDRQLEQNISIIPWDAFDSSGRIFGPGDGDNPRNLQDNKGRFRDRLKFGQPKTEFLGWTDRNINYVFIINDTLDKQKTHPSFINIFAHELFHASSNYYGLYEKLGSNIEECQIKDEMLADKFGQFVYKQIIQN